MRTEFDELVENQIIGLGLRGDSFKPDLLEEACKELMEMLLTKNPAKNDMFAGLPRVKGTIILEACLMVKSKMWKDFINYYFTEVT